MTSLPRIVCITLKLPDALLKSYEYKRGLAWVCKVIVPMYDLHFRDITVRGFWLNKVCTSLVLI